MADAIPVQEALHLEAHIRREPCRLIEATTLEDGDLIVTVVLYETGEGRDRERRVAAWAGNWRLFSSVAAMP